MKLFRRLSGREGSFMTELVIAMFLVAGMLVVIWTQYGRVKENSAISSTKEYLTTAVGQIQALYNNTAGGDAGKYTGVETVMGEGETLGKRAVDLGIFPREFLQGTSLKNPWNGAVDIANGNEVYNDTFAITFADVSQKGCIELVTLGSDWAAVSVTSSDTAVGSAVMSGTAGKIGENGNATKPIPVDASNALAGCSKKYNTITWYGY